MNQPHAPSSPRPQRILVLNAGSSTLKYALFEDSRVTESRTVQLSDKVSLKDTVRSVIESNRQWTLDAIAYRIVHGGKELTAPTKINERVLAQLRETIRLAPLHQQPAIVTIETALDLCPHAVHVGCFDTAFHATMPVEERMLALPRTYFDAGIQRFGFHGLSYESIALQLPSISRRASHGHTVVCHLGSGSSLCGMTGCQSRYTTMGFTPQDGLIMGTRCGRIDSGVVLHLLRNEHTLEQVEQLLTKQSGLLGISGTSSDMRELIQQSNQRPDAKLAVDMFCRCVAKEISAAATALGGFDALVFTAGMGENCQLVRAKIVEHLKWLGARIDESANERNFTQLQAASSSIEILRIPTDEQMIIQQHAQRLLSHD
ncbi:MAG: acetate/propionate family kinase [Pirellula sp.]